MPWPFQREHSDPEVRSYLTATSRAPRKREALAQTRFVVIDIETTGFDIARDRILSVAVFPIHGDHLPVAQSRSWLIRQSDAPLTPAVAVHGILPRETAEGTAEASMLRELLPVLSGAVVVGHHVRFDAEMLHAALARHFQAAWRNPLVDTAQLAMGTLEPFRKSGYANQRPPSLDEVCAHCGIEALGRHTAAGDAFTTAELFLLLIARLRRMVRRRPLRLGDLLPSRF